MPVAVAKLAGILGIRIVGKASQEGTLQPLDKSRGEVKSLEKLLEHMGASGFCGGKVRIAHCANEAAAEKFMQMVLAAYPQAQVQISKCLGLCSYYAEKGGLLVGYEKF